MDDDDDEDSERLVLTDQVAFGVQTMLVDMPLVTEEELIEAERVLSAAAAANQAAVALVRRLLRLTQQYHRRFGDGPRPVPRAPSSIEEARARKKPKP